MVIQNAGTGPALKVTQTGANSIAEFYDDGNALALKIADGGNVGIGTANPRVKLDVQGTILANGNVGIGTTTPITILDVWGSNTSRFVSNTNNIILKNITHIPTTSANGTTIAFDTYGSDFGTNVRTFIKAYDDSLGGGLLTFHTGNTRRITIVDAGNVGIGTANPKTTLDINGTISIRSLPIASLSHSVGVNLSNVVLTSSNFYDKVWVNNGNHFNASTGSFICPFKGIYRIYFRSTVTSANVRLYKNNGTVNEAYTNATSTNNYQSVSSEAVVECDVNDYLQIQVATLINIGGIQHTQVTFQMLG